MAKSYFNILNHKGNVLIMTAVLMPLFLMLCGMVIDIGRAFAFKAEINRACMISAEEAAKEISIDIAQSSGSSSLTGNYDDTINRFFYLNISQPDNFSIKSIDYNVVDSTSCPKYINVYATAELECFFLKLAAIDSITVNSHGCGRLKKISN
jgi:hypothetical protein